MCVKSVVFGPSRHTDIWCMLSKNVHIWFGLVLNNYQAWHNLEFSIVELQRSGEFSLYKVYYAIWQGKFEKILPYKRVQFWQLYYKRVPFWPNALQKASFQLKIRGFTPKHAVFASLKCKLPAPYRSTSTISPSNHDIVLFSFFNIELRPWILMSANHNTGIVTP